MVLMTNQLNPEPTGPRYALPLQTVSVDSDKFVSLKKPTDLDLHCHLVCDFVSTTWIKQSDWLTIRSGRDILIYSV